ncbi:MAG: von Willebrand factor type domain protein [Bacteroidetes bacterium]|jgi:Ca-activated chloride channel family protein|nr:von Willebrand factor type domain protein [Bacteroidota bacterium]
MLDYFEDIQFAEKHWFWLMLVLPVMIGWYIWRVKKLEGEVNFSSFTLFKGIKTSMRAKFRHSLFVLRILAFAFMIAALARPQSRSSWKDSKTEGIDIVVSLDLSLSMLAKDFKPNRMEVAKKVVQDFIDARPNDRIGLVTFGGVAFTQCPLTSDHKVLKNMFPQIKAGSLDQGTAIGLGLATAVARIKESKAKSKVVILISDGVNNAGEIAPMTAGELAKTFDVRVYCIGTGSRGKALQPVAIYAQGEYEYDYVDVEIDEKVMTDIADMTGGKYFRATNTESLKNICKEIDKLEKTIISEKSFTNKAEHFLPLAITAAILLLLEFVLRFTVFRAVP